MEKRDVTYIHVMKGAKPGDVEDSEQETVCYRLPEGGIDGLLPQGVLHREKFLLASDDNPRQPEPTPEEKAYVVLWFYEYLAGSPFIRRDSTRYYYLQEANCSETMQALEKAGFERDDDRKLMLGDWKLR